MTDVDFSDTGGVLDMNQRHVYSTSPNWEIFGGFVGRFSPISYYRFDGIAMVVNSGNVEVPITTWTSARQPSSPGPPQYWTLAIGDTLSILETSIIAVGEGKAVRDLNKLPLLWGDTGQTYIGIINEQ